MNILEFTLLVFMTALLAGFLGSLIGLGGGTILVPTLTLVFHVDIRYAIGASLVSVIATLGEAVASQFSDGVSASSNKDGAAAIVEAQGWVMGENGTIQLIAATSASGVRSPEVCQHPDASIIRSN
jgi:Sulfite exporter TauE/SafE